QGLVGTNDGAGHFTLDSNESVREALWGKPNAFDRTNALYQHVQELATVRASQAAVRYGRLYFRQVSANGADFGHSAGAGGVVAFSRILTDREVVVVANTHPTLPFNGFVLVDADIAATRPNLSIVYSNQGASGAKAV